MLGGTTGSILERVTVSVVMSHRVRIEPSGAPHVPEMLRRFWAGAPDEIGLLVHKRGGTWAFDYDPNSADDEEPGFKFDRHRFLPGEYRRSSGCSLMKCRSAIVNSFACEGSLRSSALRMSSRIMSRIFSLPWKGRERSA